MVQEHTSITDDKTLKHQHPFTYVNGLFQSSQLNWATLTKEAFAIHMTVRKLSFYVEDAIIALKIIYCYFQKATMNAKVYNLGVVLNTYHIRFKSGLIDLKLT